MRKPPDVREQDRPFGYAIVGDRVVGCGDMWKAHGSYYVPAQYFGDESGDVWEVRAVGEAGKSVVADDLIDLCLCTALSLGID